LSLVTCLEILSEPKDRSEVFQKVVKEALKAVKSINISSDEEKPAYDKILSLVGNLKKQSKREALEDLVSNSKEIICKSLPNDHPHKSNPMAAIDEMYKIRSKVAHNGILGKRITNEIFRSNQFAHYAAKALLKKELDFF
jgi:hypothetical protein